MMGLDQYLTAKKYVSKYEYSDNHKGITQEFQNTIPKDVPNIAEYGGFSGMTIEYPVGYWRKANAIHNFFVSEIGEGVDECQEMWVKRDILVELRSRCSDVLKADNMEEMAEEVGLKTISGLFFGNTSYEELYKEDLQLTVDICDHVLKLPEEYSIYYQASW